MKKIILARGVVTPRNPLLPREAMLDYKIAQYSLYVVGLGLGL